MKECMNKLVSPKQIGFIFSINIHENIVVVQETLHSMNKLKSKTVYFAIKVDLAKSYDNLNWKFLEQVLLEVKFPQKLR